MRSGLMAHTAGRIRYAGAWEERETRYTGGIQLTTVRPRFRRGDEGIRCFFSGDSNWLVSYGWCKIEIDDAHMHTQEPRR